MRFALRLSSMTIDRRRVYFPRSQRLCSAESGAAEEYLAGNDASWLAKVLIHALNYDAYTTHGS